MIFLKYYLLAVSCLLIGNRADLISTSSEKAAMNIPGVRVAKERLILDQTEGKWYYDDKPFSGFAIVYHADGMKAEETGFYQGKKLPRPDPPGAGVFRLFGHSQFRSFRSLHRHPRDFENHGFRN